MIFGFTRFRAPALLVWILAITAILVWSRNLHSPPGWDLRVYEHAMASLRAGHDPYADGIAVQRVFHAHLAEHPNAPPPFTYVYSPLTLLPLRLLAQIPPPIFRIFYWSLYAFSALLAMWAGATLAEPAERKAVALLAPLALAFPGLLFNQVIFSGNVAYILFALVLAAAVIGWRRGQWLWFFLAVLVTSCFKAPLLILAVIPIFSARRQWMPAAITGLTGLALFAIHPLLWPALFRHYLTAVELQFSYNHDFSASPAGLVADAFYDSVPYTVTSVAFYLLYAIPIAAILFYLSRHFLRGELLLERFAPVLLIGVTLLNPRIMEYDIAAMTIPMALVGWRFLQRGDTAPRTVAIAALLLGAWNFAGATNWRPGDCLLLVAVFSLGVWNLWTPAAARTAEYRLPERRYDGARSEGARSYV